jgi:hypothetical protein
MAIEPLPIAPGDWVLLVSAVAQPPMQVVELRDRKVLVRYRSEHWSWVYLEVYIAALRLL